MENIKLIAIDKAKLTLNGVKLPERYVDKFKTWLEQIEEVNKRTKKLLPKGTRLKSQELYCIVLSKGFGNEKISGFVGFSLDDKKHCATIVGYSVFEDYDDDYNDVQDRLDEELKKRGVSKIEFTLNAVSKNMLKFFLRKDFEVTMLEMQKVIGQSTKK